VSLKVSVVVPVYNPGAHIDDGIDSLLHQSLPADQFEAIFVDDGSTDGTGERLDGLAAEHDNVSVFHIPNSGWPGRPRNVGLDAARGEYVLFMDNDDRLGEEALERLHDRAVADGADVVVGKVVGHGRGISRELFAANRRDVEVTWPPLLQLLTPHKLFRRAFLQEQGLRFPEGRVRLEDHAFVVPAFFAARSISVLADYPVYHWIKREDETNASNRPLEHGYWQSLRDVLDVVESHVGPGELREQLLSHWLRSKMLVRLGGAGFARHPPEYQEALFGEIGAVARERMSPAVTSRVRSAMRIRARLLEAGRLDGLRALAEVEGDIGAAVTLRELAWEEGALRLRVEALLAGPDGAPLAFERDGDRVLRRLPPGLPGAEDVLEADRDVTDELARGIVHVVLRERETREEYALDVTQEVRLREHGDGVAVVYEAEARLDPASAAAGAGAPDGVWDLTVDVISGGLSASTRLPRGDVELPPPAITGEAPPRVAIPFETVEGNVSLDLGERKRSLVKSARPDADAARTSRGLAAVAVSLPLRAVAAPRAAGRPAELLLVDGGARADARARRVAVPARLVVDGGPVRLEARVPFRRRRRTEGAAGPGAWVLSAATAGEHQPLRLTLGLAADGSARITPTREGRPRGNAVPPTALGRALRRLPPVRAAVALVRRARGRA
jgi:hypothetical protein